MKALVLDKTGLLLSWMVNKKIPVHIYEHEKERWWDVGTPEDLEKARRFYAKL